MLVLLVLHLLAQLPEGLAAVRALVRVLWGLLVGVGEIADRALVQELRCFGRHEPIDSIACIVFAPARRARPALDVLDSVCGTPEALLAADRASHVAGLVDLHVLLQVVLVLALLEADLALIGRVDAVRAPRDAFSLSHLIHREVAEVHILPALRTAHPVVRLHVHVQVVLVAELPAALVTCNSLIVPSSAVEAPSTGTLPPLIAREIRLVQVVPTLAAVPRHGLDHPRDCGGTAVALSL
mmetsp:Transcript_16355/g.39896  ORF Transcript_16355/g.39896 Transcript_16355/m.39896 type:complete len:240 (-) Transcript_16355:8-727(-)